MAATPPAEQQELSKGQTLAVAEQRLQQLRAAILEIGQNLVKAGSQLQDLVQEEQTIVRQRDALFVELLKEQAEEGVGLFAKVGICGAKCPKKCVLQDDRRCTIPEGQPHPKNQHEHTGKTPSGNEKTHRWPVE